MRKIDEKCTTNKWRKEDSPVRKWLFGEMGENDFCGHPAKDKGQGQAEKSEVVVLEEV